MPVRSWDAYDKAFATVRGEWEGGFFWGGACGAARAAWPLGAGLGNAWGQGIGNALGIWNYQNNLTGGSGGNNWLFGGNSWGM